MHALHNGGKLAFSVICWTSTERGGSAPHEKDNGNMERRGRGGCFLGEYYHMFILLGFILPLYTFSIMPFGNFLFLLCSFFCVTFLHSFVKPLEIYFVHPIVSLGLWSAANHPGGREQEFWIHKKVWIGWSPVRCALCFCCYRVAVC